VNNDNEWHLISKYSREDALGDGTLIDVSEAAKGYGFVFPVAVTSSVWVGIIEPDEEGKQVGENTEGRLKSVLYSLLWAIKCVGGDGSSINHEVSLIVEGEVKKVRLKSEIGSGDDFEPVITIMFPEED
jgi:hypothetical protein